MCLENYVKYFGKHMLHKSIIVVVKTFDENKTISCKRDASIEH